MTAAARDYRLAGPNSSESFEPSQWYATPISRARLKELMQRSDRPGLINYSLWLLGILVFGCLLVWTWGTWWAVPVAIIYGVFYGSGGDSRWHECGHGTVFKTRWLNRWCYQLASFLCLRNPHLWRWSHSRHHSHTIIVGRDPEIAFPRPPSITKWLLNLLYIPTAIGELKKMVLLAFGQLSDEQKAFLPDGEYEKTFFVSRVHLAIVLTVVAASLYFWTWLPLMLIGLPTYYGSWLHHLMATTQHAGLAEDIPDHRMNSRTILMNPFFRFIYSNMNYHVEHHMYPMVPYYNLPALHAEIRGDCPAPYTSMWDAYREMVPAIWRQQTDPNHYVKRALPQDAGPTPSYDRPVLAA